MTLKWTSLYILACLCRNLILKITTMLIDNMCLLCVRHHAEKLNTLISFNFHNKLMKQFLLLVPFFKWGDYKVVQLICSSVDIKLWKVWFHPFSHHLQKYNGWVNSQKRMLVYTSGFDKYCQWPSRNYIHIYTFIFCRAANSSLARNSGNHTFSSLFRICFWISIKTGASSCSWRIFPQPPPNSII